MDKDEGKLNYSHRGYHPNGVSHRNVGNDQTYHSYNDQPGYLERDGEKFYKNDEGDYENPPSKK